MITYFGKIKIPQDNWSELKQKLLSVYNTNILRDYRLAVQGYNYVMEQYQVDKKINCKKTFIEWLIRFDINLISIEFLLYILFPAERILPFKPKKKDFVTTTNKTTTLDLLRGSKNTFLISLLNEEKALELNISMYEDTQNKDYLDLVYIESFPVAEVLFSSLKKIKWNKFAGGIIYSQKVDNNENKSEAEIFMVLGNYTEPEIELV